MFELYIMDPQGDERVFEEGGLYKAVLYDRALL